jgi:WD40 repeat protein
LDDAAAPIAFSPDGRTLATRLGDGEAATIALWDVGTGRATARFGDATAGRPGAITFSPDGRRLAAGLPLVDINDRWSRDVTVWDLATRRPVAFLPAVAFLSSYLPSWHRPRSGLEFSPNGRFLVIRGDGRGLFWDVTVDPPRCLDELLEIHGDHSEVGRMAFVHPLFSPDGSRFVVPGRLGRTLAIHDAVTLAPRSVGKVGLDGFRRPRSAISLDGHWLAVACRSSSPQPSRFEAWLAGTFGRPFLWSGPHADVRVYNLTTGGETGRVPTDGGVLGFAADGRSFWTYTQMPTTINYPRANPTTLEVRQWAVPSGWPPAWLLGVTVVGVLLIAADWQRGRRRATAGVIP